MTENTFFIYMHRRLDTGDIFYIGKGTRTSEKEYRRAYEKFRRSKFWNSITKKSAYSVELFADFFSEDDAFDMERALIAKYKRRCDGGTLCNISLGGEGPSGFSHDPETRAKISAALSGSKNNNYGKKHSTETRRKQSESLRGRKLSDSHRKSLSLAMRICNHMREKVGAKNPGSRKVRDRATGAVYDTIKIAASTLGHNMKTLHGWLSGRRRNPTTLEYA